MSIKLGVDLDGVIADWMKSYTSFVSKKKGTAVFNTLDYPSAFSLQAFYQSERSFDAMYDAWLNESQNPFTKIPDIDPYQTDILAYFHNQPEYDISFLTSRDNSSGHSVEQQSKAWLQLRGFLQPHVYQTSHAKRRSSGLPTKGQVSAALGLDYMLDDTPVELDSVAMYSPDTTPILMRRPYNVANTDYTSVRDISEFMRLVKK